MAVAVTWGTTLAGFSIVNPSEGGINAVTFTHSGGDILVVWVGTDMSGTPDGTPAGSSPTALANVGAIAAVPLAVNHTWASHAGIRAWRYPAVPSGARTVTITAPLDIVGVLIPFSVTGWSGSISAVTVGPTNGTVDLSHDVTITANDMIVGFWSQTAASAGSLTIASGTQLLNLSHGQQFDINGNYSVNATRYVAATKTGSGAQTVSFTQSGWSSPVGISCAFALLAPTSQTFTQAVGGNLNFSGALTRQSLLGKPLTGNLSFNGVLTKSTSRLRSLAGTLSFSGTLATFRPVFRVLAGVLSFSGALALAMGRALTGTLSFSGELTTKALPLKQALDGVLSWVGDLVTQTTIGRQLDGFLSFSGTLLRDYINAARRFVVATTKRFRYKRLGDG